LECTPKVRQEVKGAATLGSRLTPPALSTQLASPGGEGYERAAIGNGRVGTRCTFRITGIAIVCCFRAGIGSWIG
jgi:hypothetical protein